MLSVEDRSLKGAGFHLKRKIWNAARTTIREWTGQELSEVSLYGIRVRFYLEFTKMKGVCLTYSSQFLLFLFYCHQIYEEGAVLAPHVDRLPLVSSAIINVDQDVDEPWYVYVCCIAYLDPNGFPCFSCFEMAHFLFLLPTA